MSYVQVHSVVVNTNAANTGVGYTPVVTGWVSHVIYNRNGTIPFDNAANVTIRTEATNELVWNASLLNTSRTVAPRQATHNSTGNAAVYATGFPVLDRIYLAHDRMVITANEAGANTTGQFYVVIA